MTIYNQQMNDYDILTIQNQLDSHGIHHYNQKWINQQITTSLDWFHFPTSFINLVGNLKMTGQKLLGMDNAIKMLTAYLQPSLNQTMLFPFNKFISILNCIINADSNEIVSPKDFKNQQQKLIQISSLNQVFINTKLGFQRQNKLKYESQVIEKFMNASKQFFRGTDTNNSLILLTHQKVIQLMKEAESSQDSIQIFSKLHIDGFGLICSMFDEQFLMILGNYIEKDSINLIQYYSGIFLLIYLRQMDCREIVYPKLKKEDTIDSPQLRKQKRRISISNEQIQNAKNDISAEDIIKMLQGSDTKQNNENEQFGKSYTGQSDLGQSFAGSVLYANSEDFTENELKNGNQHQAYISSIQQTENIKQIKLVALSLDFNLLNLEPLIQIKISKLPNPFTTEIRNPQINKEKIQNSQEFNNQYNPQTKIFSLEGAKFGREQTNDFCFPDEPSISGKHAQIYFKSDQFYLRDLGSKTGTFLRINKPIILYDETCLTYRKDYQKGTLQFIQEEKEGAIKIDFNKPEGFPGYQAFLKEGCVKIGRSQNSHIRIDDDKTTIASKHGQIKYQGGNFWFVDKKSSKGSWLRLSKRSKVSEGYKLAKGDIFRISSKRSYKVQDIKMHQTQ